MRRVALLLVLVASAASAGGLPEEGDSVRKLRRQYDRRDMACFKGRAEACEWVGAFLRVELAASEAACERGDGNACLSAATHYGTINDGMLPAGFAIPEDRAKRAYYHMRACDAGIDWTRDRPEWTNDTHTGAVLHETPEAQRLADAYQCDMAARLVADGAFGTFDLATAELLYRRACDVAGQPHESCEFVTRGLEWQLAQTPEQRAARIEEERAYAREQEARQRADVRQASAELAAYRAERWDVAADALATGIASGLEQNAAIQGSLDAAAQGISATVAESDRLAAERAAAERAAAEERRRQVWSAPAESSATSSASASEGSGSDCPAPKSYNCWAKCVGDGDEAPKICPAI